MYSIISPMPRYICHSPLVMLNFDNELVVDDAASGISEPEYADRTEYMTRMPRNGKADDIAMSSVRRALVSSLARSQHPI
jgi:hypothetical protein